MFAQLMGLKTISPDALNRRLEAGDPIAVFDVNAPLSWAANRVPGAINLDPLAYRESDLPQAKDAAVVFYCSNYLCRKAPNAARRAKQMGYVNVLVMSAGISGWMSAHLPTDAGA